MSDGDPWSDVASVERARLCARARSLLQEIDATEAEALTEGLTLEALGCQKRSHELLPYEVERIRALGKKHAREHGW